MNFSEKEVNFIREARENLSNYIYERKNFPSDVTWSKIQNFIFKAGDIDETATQELQNIKEDIDELCALFQQANIEKISRTSGKKPMVFHNTQKSELNPSILIKHSNLLTAAKDASDELHEGLVSIKHDLVAAKKVVAHEANILGKKVVEHAKSTGKQVADSVKKHGKTAATAAKEGAKAVIDGTIFVGGAVVSAAEYINEKIDEAINKAVSAMEMSVSNANLDDARALLKNFQIGANETLYHTLQAAKKSIKVLHEDWDDDEITQEAKVVTDYYKLEKSIKELTKMTLGVGDTEQRNIGISLLQQKMKEVQQTLNSSVASSTTLFHEAQQHVNSDFQDKQQQGWLLDKFKEFKSIKHFEQKMEHFDTLIAQQANYDTWKEKDKEEFEELFNDLQQLCNTAVELCADKQHSQYLDSLTTAQKALLISKANDAYEDYAPNCYANFKYMLEQLKEVDIVEKQRELNLLTPELAEAQQFLQQADHSGQYTEKFADKTVSALQAARSFVPGLLRLGHKGLSKIIFSMKKTISNIWQSIKNIVNSTPSLADKLVAYTAKITENISNVFDKFASSMSKIIGIKKAIEDKDAIYQHQAFQPKQISKLVNEYYINGTDNQYVIASNPDRKKPYPYNLSIELELKDYKNGNKTIKEQINLISFQKREIEILSLPDVETLAKKGQLIPADQIRKFEEAQQQIMHILSKDRRGLLNMPRANEMTFTRFDDKHYMNLMLGSPVVERYLDKIKLKQSQLSPETEERFKAIIQRNKPKPSDMFDDVVAPSAGSPLKM